jgi:hypothetical protein
MSGAVTTPTKSQFRTTKPGTPSSFACSACQSRSKPTSVLGLPVPLEADQRQRLGLPSGVGDADREDRLGLGLDPLPLPLGEQVVVQLLDRQARRLQLRENVALREAVRAACEGRARQSNALTA